MWYFPASTETITAIIAQAEITVEDFVALLKQGRTEVVHEGRKHYG
jgi:hypothetical protein